ncbi:MAG: dicarboxylate/amino acid:cation symporter [Bacteroidota bacterium]
MNFSLRKPRILLGKPKLHNQILLGLFLGVIFGVLFNIDKHKLEVTYRANGTEKQTVIEYWEAFEFLHGEASRIFGPDDQSAILQFFKGLKGTERNDVILVVRTRDQEEHLRYDQPLSIKKVETIATLIKPIGTIFLRLLMFIAIPLVVASLIVGAASLGDIRKVARLGGKTVGFYLITTSVAITIGLSLVNFIRPGERLPSESRGKLMAEYQADISTRIEQEIEFDLIDTFVNIVPTNPIEALANAEMLQIVFFSIMIGLTLSLVRKEKAQPVISFFEGISETMIKIVDLIMLTAPFGVFALIAATVGEFGFEILQTLFWYAIVVIAGLLLHLFGTLSLLVRFLAKMSPLKFFRGLREPMLIAFTSSSSGATLPVNMEATEKNLGVPKQITSFVLPLGATINMDGTSLYQAVAAVFIAQVYGFDLTLGQQLTILLTAVLASIGTAPVPGVGIIMLIIVLQAVNVPEEGIALILGVDRILDMSRTVINVSGDAAVASIVARSEGVLQESEAAVGEAG